LKRLYRSGSFDRIIGIGRDVTRGKQAFEDVRALHENDTNVEFIECDLTKTQSIRQFATTISTKMPQIDLLINNAGIMDAPQTVNKVISID
jgi:short-subunit dehydrogenase